MKKIWLSIAWLIACVAVTPLAHAAVTWDAQDYTLYAGDFNGDGETDLLYIAKNPNNPSGIALSNGTSPNIVWQEWPSNYLGINWSSNAYTVIVADFNGDGRADILLQANTSGATSYLFLMDTTGHFSAITESISPTLFGANFVFTADQHKLVAGDFNGDGKADLFLQATNPAGTDAVIFVGTNGQFSGTPVQSWSDGFNGLKWATTEANVYAGHFAAGPMADLLVQAKPRFVEINYDVPFPVPGFPANMNAVLLAQSGGVFSASGVGVTKWSRFANGVDWSPLTATVVVGDFNGDGISDVILQGKHSSTPSYLLLGTGTSAMFSSTPETLSSNVAVTADSGNLIVGNFTGAVSRAVGIYVQALTPAGTDYVADSITISGTTATVSVSADPPPEPITQSYGALAMLPLDTTANNQRYFPYLSTVTSTQAEVGGPEDAQLITTTVTNYGTPDSYGNFNSVTTTVTDNDPASPYYNDTWTSTTANTIAPNTSTWCLNLPTQTTITKSNTAPSGAAITQTVAYTPDYTHCRETQKIVAPGTAYQVTETYGYDTTVGNLLTDTVTGVGMTPRVTTIGWNSIGQFPQTIQNPLLQAITLGFDPNSGVKTSQTDPNYTSTNPLTITWQYDDFARMVKELRPDGTSTTWSYNSCGSGCVNVNNRMTVTKTVLNTDGTPQRVTNVYLDAVDRTLVTSSTMLNGAYDRRETQYNPLGLVQQQGAPCTLVSCTNYWTTFNYDVLNRVTQSQRPVSAKSNTLLQTMLYGYAGRTSTVTDPKGNTTTKINLVTGSVARSQDAIGYYQNFTYDAFGSLLFVTDSASNALFSALYSYGLGAFQTSSSNTVPSSSDMDLGARFCTIDPLGEITAYSDAKGQHFSMTYDALSRPLIRTEPDLTTTWTWGSSAANYNIGMLQSVTGASSAGTYTEAYTYESKTRLSAKSITIPGDASYTYSYTYNPTTELPYQLTYPSSTSGYQLKLQYLYTNGLLASVRDAAIGGTFYWTANTTNPRGQTTEETLGNGVITNRSFDAVTGWLGTIQAGVGGGAALQNSGFAYDEVGNVIQRQNNSNLGLTENFYYDADYRLLNSTLGGTTNLTMTYDATGMGNIASRSDVAGGAAWTYDPVKKHAVTQAGSSSYTYTYDANGNARTRNGYNVTWTSYNYPSGINSAGESATFQYGPDRQRWQTIYTGSIGTETTYHVGKSLEKVVNGGTTDYRHYIFAGNELVAIYSRMASGTNTLRYVLEDHQGSFASIVTSAGTPDVNESFTAYGNRRNASTWSGAPTSSDETAINGVSREGYTGQTALGVSMGLNHMNGRVEDAITGRFLSPDPYIPDPGNTQSFNRYSYVNNNPLSLVDPTGFDDVTPDPPSDPGSSSNDNGGTGDGPSGYNDGGLYGYQGQVYNAGLWDVTNLQEGFNVNGYLIQSPGSETHSVVDASGATSPLYDESQLQNETNTLNEIQVQAPAYHWISGSASGSCSDCPVDLSPLSRGVGRYGTPEHAFAQTIEFGINGALLAESGINLFRLARGFFAAEGVALESGASSSLQGFRLSQQLAAEEAAGASAPTSIESYSAHALEQIAGRDGGIGVSQTALEDAFANPNAIQYAPSAYGPTFRFIGNGATVVVNPQGNVVTGWATSVLGVGP